MYMNELERFVSLESDTAHDSPVAAVVPNCNVLKAPVVPHRHVSSFPAVTASKVRKTDLGEEIVKDWL